MILNQEKRIVKVDAGDEFVLERDIPIVGMFRSVGSNFRYPFKDMFVGESFEVTINESNARRVVCNISSACSYFIKRNNSTSKFTVRRTSETTVRCWRIK
jgi:hypothetical protein